ncbi:MAG: hypothetical protein OHK0022_00730 [Roseiflexaceae bacterium]
METKTVIGTPTNQLGNILSGTPTPSEMLATLAKLAGTRFASIQEALNTYLEVVGRMVGVRSAFVAHLTNEVMEVLGAWDDNGCGIPAGGVEPLEETFCQYVRASATPVMVTQADRDPRVQNVSTRNTFNIGSYLGVPLIVENGELFGTLCLLDPEPRLFSDDHVHMLTIVGQQLARLIERELLHKTIDNASQTKRDLQTTLSTLDEQSILLQTVAHDLRTPLTSIRGHADMLRSGMLGPVTTIQQEALTQVSIATVFMNRLVTDLFDAAKSERRSLMVVCEPYHPVDLLHRVATHCRHQADERGLRLEVDAPADLPEAVSDTARVEQILLNLVSNALRYTDAGTVTLRARVDGNQIEYRVDDTGPGIDPAAQQRIWNLHTRASNDGRGLGLGLYIVRRLAQVLDGETSLESAPGLGSSFRVRFPLRLERPKRVEIS